MSEHIFIRRTPFHFYVDKSQQNAMDSKIPKLNVVVVQISPRGGFLTNGAALETIATSSKSPFAIFYIMKDFELL